jgi:membrane protease YdiL (CAAX protease family)
MEAVLPEPKPITTDLPPRQVLVYPTLKESWAVLGWLLLVSLVVGTPLYLLFHKLLPIQKQLGSVLITAAIEIALIAFLWWKAGIRRPTLQLRGREILWLYLVLPVLVLTQNVVVSLIQYLHLPNWVEANIERLMQQPVLGFLMLCVVAPVLEETLFRGIILGGLLRNYRPWVAIGQSALLFGLFHMNTLQVVGAGLLGLTLGWLYYRTRSLWLCIALHFVNNFFAFCAMLADKHPGAPDKLPHASVGSWGAYATMVLTAGLILGFLLYRVQQATAPSMNEATDPEPDLTTTTLA